MNIMHLIPHGFDLNLISVFYAIYKFHNVTQAAESLYISPSAFSHALNRLRTVLNDPLFIRIDGKMQPTKKAEAIAPTIIKSLEILSLELFSDAPFDNKNAAYEFSIAATEYTLFSVLPLLIQRCRNLAPHVSLKVVHENKNNSFKNIQLGKIDFTIGYSEYEETLSKNIDSFVCFTDRYVVVTPKGKYTSMSLDEYIQANHIRISTWHEHNGVIDQSLKNLGLMRNIVIELPNIMSSPYMIENSDLIITLPYKAANILKEIHPITLFELPFHVPEYEVQVFSLKEQELNSAQTWLINQIKEAFIGK